MYQKIYSRNGSLGRNVSNKISKKRDNRNAQQRANENGITAQRAKTINGREANKDVKANKL